MNILEELKKRILVLDGAMGTMLYSLGIPKGHCYDELNISNPDIVQRVHRGYLDAGADIIETNTFGANRHILEKYFDLGDKTVEINANGVRIAKEVAAESVVIAGSIGPITRPMEGEKLLPDDRLETIFAEQVEALLTGGADMLVLETFTSVSELLVALRTARRIGGDIPVAALLSFNGEGRTLFGDTPQQAATMLSDAGARIMGVNCSIGPQNTLDALSKMASLTDAKLVAMPNAGRPTFADGKFIYPASPDYFANYARRFVAMGVNIVGGCCGSGFEHIKAIKSAVGGLAPRERKNRVSLSTKTIRKEKEGHRYSPTDFHKKLLLSRLALTVEVDPPRGAKADKIESAAAFLADCGVDAVNIADLPLARLRMGALPAAEIVLSSGLDVVLHITARDRNIIALQSDLLGAYALGVRNVLALRGDPPSVGDYPFATGVYDVDSEGLVSIISSLNSGSDRLGTPLDEPTSLCIGVATNPNLTITEHEIKRLKRKLAAGAHFIQTQPVYDIQVLRPLLELVPEEVPIIVSVLPFWSVRHAEFIQNEVPGIFVPEGAIERMRAAKDPREEGIRIAAEIIASLPEQIAGVCIMPPFGHIELVPKIMSIVADGKTARQTA